MTQWHGRMVRAGGMALLAAAAAGAQAARQAAEYDAEGV